MAKDFLLFRLAQRVDIGEIRIENVKVFNAPRGAQRLRRNDLLACMITVQQGTPLTSQEIQNYLQKAAEAFYATNGSVTRALQAAAETINQDLLETNIHNPGGQGPTEAGLNLAVWHKGSIFHAHCGSAISVCIQESGVDLKRDSVATSKSLGVKRAIDLQFYQTDFPESGLLILCPQLPESWTRPMLQNSHTLNAEQLKRRLVNRTDIDITAGVILINEGNGNASLMEWPQRTERPPLELPVKSEELPQDNLFSETNLPEKSEFPNLVQDKKVSLFDEGKTINPEIFLPAHVEEMIEIQPGEAGEETIKDIAQSVNQIPDYLRPLATGWMAIKKANIRWNRFLMRLNAMLPFGLAGRGTLFSVTVMRATVFLVPLVLSLIFSAVYTKSGQSGKYQELMQAAQEYASQAEKETDAVLRREFWRKALESAQGANTYLETNESVQLADLAEIKLDELDLVSRLDFRPALTTMLPVDIQISRMLSASSGIYALDSASGTLLRLFLNSKGFYELDKEFKCRIESNEIGKSGVIIDFATLPANDSNYRVVALDSTGNLLYCQPGAAAVSRTLIPPPEGWKHITGFAYDSDKVYVLDAAASQVWRYSGEDPNNSRNPGIAFLQAPVSFFDEEIPDLSGAIDLAVNQDDLYVLHADGHMTTCQYGADKDYQLTDCIDPAPYNDSRLGREKNPWIFMDSSFSMMQDMRMPTPSLYILDEQNKAVMRFSYILSLEKVFKAKANRNYPLPAGAPSGIMATADQELFLAFGNQLFFAPLR